MRLYVVSAFVCFILLNFLRFLRDFVGVLCSFWVILHALVLMFCNVPREFLRYFVISILHVVLFPFFGLFCDVGWFCWDFVLVFVQFRFCVILWWLCVCSLTPIPGDLGDCAQFPVSLGQASHFFCLSSTCFFGHFQVNKIGLWSLSPPWTACCGQLYT